MINQEIKYKIEKLGLREDDIDKDIDSLTDIIDFVSSSGRLFRKSLKTIILKEIQLYFDNNSIKDTDKLISFFSRKNRKFEWIKFSNYFDLIVPGLKLTRVSILSLIIYFLTIVYFIIRFTVTDTLLVADSIVSGLAGWFAIIVTIIPLGLIGLLGQTRLPYETMDDLIEGIIHKNIGDLLADDKKRFKEIILKELSDK